MIDKEKTANQLRIKRNSIEQQIMLIEERWHKKGRVDLTDAVEFDLLTFKCEELTERINDLGQ